MKIKLLFIGVDYPYEWELLEDIHYLHITVPQGFRTDLASVPRILWSIFPPFGRYIRASIVHDYLYLTKTESKSYSDLIFKDIMREDGVHPLQVSLFYLAVKFFGIY